MKIVIGTHNLDKLREIKGSFNLDSLSIDIMSLESFPEIGEIPENGKTLRENALIKARTVNKLTGIAALSDDTGLEVDALNGRPGVYTARYAGENCSYNDNVMKLLAELERVPMPNRTASFKTVVAYVDGSFEIIVEGIAEGKITRSIIGHEGFGYDPVFFIPEANKTFAEMSLEQKDKYSHRGKAIRKMKEQLLPYLKNTIKKELA